MRGVEMKGIVRFSALAAPALLLCISCEDPGGLFDYCPPYDPMIIDTHVTWSVDYHPDLITRDILVKPDGKLEILAGTQIQFLPRSVTVCDPAGNMKRDPCLEVEGSLVIRGAENAMVSFFPKEGSDAEFGPVRLRESSPGQGECFIEWASLSRVDVAGFSPVIRFCDLKEIYVRDSDDVEIVGNTVGIIFALLCEGVIAENTLDTGIFLRDDSLVVLRNQISRPRIEGVAGIVSAGSSRAYIAENCLLDCGIGIAIFSGSPTINFNDFIDCQININVMPFIDSAETDTIDARYNWWGTADESEILSKIVYAENKDTWSGKVILIDPFETQPLMVCR